MTRDQANDFRLTIIFRVGDWAVRHFQGPWHSEYSVATKTEGSDEVRWEGGYDTLGELLAFYSPEILADYRLAIAQDYANPEDLEDIDRAEKVVKTHRFDLVEADAKAEKYGTPAHWDSINLADKDVIDPDSFPRGVVIVRNAQS